MNDESNAGSIWGIAVHRVDQAQQKQKWTYQSKLSPKVPIYVLITAAHSQFWVEMMHRILDDRLQRETLYT